MTIAIEKASPVGPSVIFWNNFVVVTRFTVTLGALLWFFYLLQADEPNQNQIILAALLVALGSFRASRDIESGIIFRRLRYKGVFTASRAEPTESTPSQHWHNTVPPWGLSSKFRNSVSALADPILETLEPSVVYAQFAVGVDETGEFVLRKVHSCDNVPENCDKPAVHLFGYNEERDGRIWWGS